MSVVDRPVGSSLLAICENRTREVGIACISPYSSSLYLSQFCDVNTYLNTLTMIYIYQPKQILVPNTASNSHLMRYISHQFPLIEIILVERKFFSETRGSLFLDELVCSSDHSSFEVLISNKYLCLASAAAVTHYIQSTQEVVFLPHSLRIHYTPCEGSLMIDSMTIKALELVEPNVIHGEPQLQALPGKRIKCLFDILNHTLTPQGSRLLRSTLLQPPSDIPTIKLRQSSVREMLEDEKLYFGISASLSPFCDMEPLLSMLVQNQSEKSNKFRSNGKEINNSTSGIKETIAKAVNKISALIRLKRNILALPNLLEVLKDTKNPLFVAIRQNLSSQGLKDILKLLNESMTDFASQHTQLSKQSHNSNIGHQKEAFNSTSGPSHHNSRDNDLPVISVQQSSKNAIKDVVYALKEGVNGLLDTARKVYKERIDDIKELWDFYMTEYANELVNAKLHYTNKRGYFMSIAVKNHTKKPSKSKTVDFETIESDDEIDDTRNQIDHFSQNDSFSSNLDAFEILKRPKLSSEQSVAFAKLPDIFIRRHYKGNRLQFVTEDLLALNTRLKEALDEIIVLTSKLLLGVQTEICKSISCLYKMEESIALLDMIFSFATYVTLCPTTCCCPEFDQNNLNESIAISGGYHPILLFQSGNSANAAIPNDTYSSKYSTFLHIITGKNNAGKTTYLLQIATLAVMAHMGCFIPARFASFCLLDRILSRFQLYNSSSVTHTDMDSSGSSFYTEMKQISYMMSSCTDRSLLLIDELGKSSFAKDSVPLCFAICEHLIYKRCFTFFATHWLDMATCLERFYPQVLVHKIQSASSEDQTGNSIYKITEGCEVDSGYGIELAEKAGWPSDVLDTARHVRRLRLSESPQKCQQNDNEQYHVQTLSVQEMRLKRMIVDQLKMATRANLDQMALREFLMRLSQKYRLHSNETE